MDCHQCWSIGNVNQASAWELVLDEARFTLTLSPDVSRGFSGEGQVLTDLATRRWEETLPRVQASLRWGTRIEPDAIAAACAFDRVGRVALE